MGTRLARGPDHPCRALPPSPPTDEPQPSATRKHENVLLRRSGICGGGGHEPHPLPVRGEGSQLNDSVAGPAARNVMSRKTANAGPVK